jgi:stage V sporulation protein R
MSLKLNYDLTPELELHKRKIIGLANDYGLSFHPIKFLLVTPEELNGIAAYGGFPTRIPHWTHGMAYEDLYKKYKHGAGKIYELVINTNPVYAYLLTTNPVVDQKLVIAHVCGHADFFYNNCWFSPTDKNMLNQMANNAARVRRIIQKVGHLEVEKFIDTCKSLDNLVDPYKPHYPVKNRVDEDEDYDLSKRPIPKLKAKGYMDKYINTDEYKAQQRKKLEEEIQRNKQFPRSPDRDILGFLVEHATNLERWQRDILGMIREEAYYFAPQGMTKIINEGWASFWHSKLMTEHLAVDSDIVDYCDRHAGVMATGKQLNPYKLGIELLKDIEDRWDRGAFGPEYEACNSIEERDKWDKGLGKGREKLFQVRKTHNDLTFIDTFLTPEFCVKQKMYSYEKDKQYHSFYRVNKDFQKVKTKLLDMLTNSGQPIIRVANGNYDNKGELLIEHIHEGTDLDVAKAENTLKNLFTIWGRPVHIQTIEDDSPIFWSYDGESHDKTLLV